MQAEEREKEKDKLPQNKKLAKPISNMKSSPSPRLEHRKIGSQTSLSVGSGLAASSVGGLSPALAHRSVSKCILM